MLGLIWHRRYEVNEVGVVQEAVLGLRVDHLLVDTGGRVDRTHLAHAEKELPGKLHLFNPLNLQPLH